MSPDLVIFHGRSATILPNLVDHHRRQSMSASIAGNISIGQAVSRLISIPIPERSLSFALMKDVVALSASRATCVAMHVSTQPRRTLPSTATALAAKRIIYHLFRRPAHPMSDPPLGTVRAHTRRLPVVPLLRLPPRHQRRPHVNPKNRRIIAICFFFLSLSLHVLNPAPLDH